MSSKRKLCAPTRVGATAVSSFCRRKGRRSISADVVCESRRQASISQLSDGNEATTTTSLSDAVAVDVDLVIEKNGGSLPALDVNDGSGGCDDECGTALHIVTSPSSPGESNGEECSNDDVIDMRTRKEHDDDDDSLPVLDLASRCRYRVDAARTHSVPYTPGGINVELSHNTDGAGRVIDALRREEGNSKEAETVGGECSDVAVSRQVMEKIKSTLDGVATWREKYELVEELIAELEFIKERLILQKTHDTLPSMTSSPFEMSSSLSNDNCCKSAVTWTSMGDQTVCSDEVLIKDLRTWQQHAKWFIDFAKKTIEKSTEQRKVLTERSHQAHSAMAAFVKELQQQLLDCVEKFEGDIQSFVDLQVNETAKRNALLVMQIKEAETNIKNIDAVLKSTRRLSSEGYAASKECEQFFSKCYDGANTMDEYKYLEFVPAGRLIVRSDHLGYIRKCDAWPNDVDIVRVNAEQAIRGRVCKVLIRTNRRHCINATASLTIKLMDPENNELPVELKNNKDGSYFASFTPEQTVRHELHVQLFGVEVKNSPMLLDVMDDPDTGSPLLAMPPFASDGDHISRGRGYVRGVTSKVGRCSLDVRSTKSQFDDAVVKKEHEDTYRSVSPSESLSKLSMAKTANCEESFDECRVGGIKSPSSSILERKYTTPRDDQDCIKTMLSRFSSPNASSSLTSELSSPSFSHQKNNEIVYRIVKKCTETAELTDNDCSSSVYSFSSPKFQKNSFEPMDHAIVKTELIQDSSVSIGYTHKDHSIVYNASAEQPEPDNQFAPVSVVSGHSKKHKNALLVKEPQIDVSSILNEYIQRGVKRVKTQFVTRIGQPGDADDSLFMPVGVTVNKRGDVIVCDMRHNAVKVFSSDGNFLFLIKGDANRRLMRPSAAVVNDDLQIFIKDDKCLHVYSSTGSFAQLIGSGELTRPYGLAINKNDQLMTVDVVRVGPPLICTYSQDGRLLNRCLFTAMSDPMLFNGSKLRFVECVEDAFFIVDLGRSVVFKTDFDGNLLTAFGHVGRAIGEFNEPSGITKSSNVLLIADSRNNRIQVFTTDGAVHGCVELAESIIRPSDIHLTSTGLLYVSNYLKHCIKVYRIIPL